MLSTLLESNYVGLGSVRTKEQVFRLCRGAIESQAVASPLIPMAGLAPIPFFPLTGNRQSHSFSLSS